jgi:phage terminase large subunit-like protein
MLPEPVRRDAIASQPDYIKDEMLRGEWWWTARPEQVPPEDLPWFICLALAGRGWGKSRAGSEWMVGRILKHPYDSFGVPTEWLVIGETLSDARAICLEGPAGILRVLERKGVEHQFLKSPRPRIVFPNGVKLHTEGADDPDVGRGYNAAGAWLDEVCKWRYPKESWDEGIMPSLRANLVGDQPRAFVTTTPKPIKLLQEWIKRTDNSIHIMRGSTFDNANNLSAAVLVELRNRYEGTLIGRQELYGEMLEAFEGALFNRLDLENYRVTDTPDGIINTIVGVDPSLTGEDDEMGVVVVANTRDYHMYVLADRSIMAVGRAAALHAWRAVADYGADMLIYEANLGKRWMQTVFEDAYKESCDLGLFPKGTRPPMKPVDAKHGKRTRAEPVAMRSEQGKLHMVGRMEDLEDQLVTFTSWGADESPDRLDAMVHACRWLMSNEKKASAISSPTMSASLQNLFAQSRNW